MKMEWPSQLNRIIVTVGSFASLAGAFLIGQDPANTPFDWNPEDIGLLLVWAGAIASFASTVLRGNWIPGVTTGVGTEQ